MCFVHSASAKNMVLIISKAIMFWLSAFWFILHYLFNHCGQGSITFLTTVFCAQCKCLKNMVLAMGEAMIFVVDSDEAVGQCDDEDMRKLEALAANKNDETAAIHSIGF